MQKCIGAVLGLLGATFAVMWLRVFWRVGLGEALDGVKGGLYCWILSATVLFPMTAGIALFRGAPGGRTFVGAWLVFTGLLVPGSLLFFVRDYRIWPDICVCAALFGPPPILGGLFLLVRGDRGQGSRLPKGNDPRETEE